MKSTRFSPRSAPRIAASWLAVMVAVLLYTLSAVAGTLQLRDTANLLAAEDKAQLHSEGARFPFDVRVVTTSEYADRESFSRYVSAQVANPNMVVVGVDPTHRRTSVHFGTGTQISGEKFSAIEKAGNESFRRGDWRGGIEAILAHSAASVGTAPAVNVKSDTPGYHPDSSLQVPQRRPSFPFGTILLVGLVVGGILLAVRAYRRRAANREYPYGPYRQPDHGPGPGYGQGNYGPGYGPPPGYGPGSGLGSGLLGAGLGGLMGYELGRSMGEHEHEHDRGDQSQRHESSYSEDATHDTGRWDAGGATSDWDGDFGGGGGDFGGGGGGGSDW